MAAMAHPSTVDYQARLARAGDPGRRYEFTVPEPVDTANEHDVIGFNVSSHRRPMIGDRDVTVAGIEPAGAGMPIIADDTRCLG
jgi:leucyl aminopeptidase (aminopeptidase T)